MALLLSWISGLLLSSLEGGDILGGEGGRDAAGRWGGEGLLPSRSLLTSMTFLGAGFCLGGGLGRGPLSMYRPVGEADLPAPVTGDAAGAFAFPTVGFQGFGFEAAGSAALGRAAPFFSARPTTLPPDQTIHLDRSGPPPPQCRQATKEDVFFAYLEAGFPWLAGALSRG